MKVVILFAVLFFDFLVDDRSIGFKKNWYKSLKKSLKN